MTTRLFVYGTLLAGEVGHAHLARARFVREARTAACFELRDLGEFPALVAGGAQAVAGEVYEVDSQTLAELDAFEDHPSYYRRSLIALDDGTRLESYLLAPEHVADQPRIGSGSWRAYRRGSHG